MAVPLFPIPVAAIPALIFASNSASVNCFAPDVPAVPGAATLLLPFLPAPPATNPAIPEPRIAPGTRSFAGFFLTVFAIFLPAPVSFLPKLVLPILVVTFLTLLPALVKRVLPPFLIPDMFCFVTFPAFLIAETDLPFVTLATFFATLPTPPLPIVTAVYLPSALPIPLKIPPKIS